MIPELNIWEHSGALKQLCYRRGLDLEPEMDCAAQGAELLAPFINGQKSKRLKLLDIGCAGGHFYHSLNRRNLEVDYHGLDYSPSIVKMAQKAFQELGLEPSKILLGDLRDLINFSCDLVAMINVLTFNGDFREPLDRLAETGAQAMVIRDFFGPKTIITYERDGFLDEGFNHLKGYWNQWSRSEVSAYLTSLGYKSSFVTDARTQGQTELVVNKAYRWSWLVAEKI
ncbi:MAG: class I SAM-dependent methyltransferase [Deltaproteobacteria bacterium]|jgi:SAM-dependent methyltransferase|nr:class I SAM-dependent methyltransferase [Deltaproteobacteria bacterium]